MSVLAMAIVHRTAASVMSFGTVMIVATIWGQHAMDNWYKIGLLLIVSALKKQQEATIVRLPSAIMIVRVGESAMVRGYVSVFLGMLEPIVR